MSDDSGEPRGSREKAELPTVMSLDLLASHAAVRVARNVLRSFARLNRIPDSEIDTLLLAASELLANAVDHGGGEAALESADATARMALRLELYLGRWVLEVADEGGGDVEEVRALIDGSQLPDLEDERGRGFFLLVGMVDGLEVEPSPDGRGLCIRAAHAHGAGRGA